VTIVICWELYRPLTVVCCGRLLKEYYLHQKRAFKTAKPKIGKNTKLLTVLAPNYWSETFRLVISVSKCL